MSKLVLLGILFLGAVAPGYSQLVSFGVKAGVPLNDAINTVNGSSGTTSTDTNRWIVGPTAEFHLPFHLGFEVDALYRRENYGVTALVGNFSPTSTVVSHNSINNWQFPFLAKYEVRGGLLRPFIDGGVTYRHLSGDGLISNANTAGVTVGGGLAVKLLFLRFTPEIRYTHWGDASTFGAGLATQSQNQADFLLGFTF